MAERVLSVEIGYLLTKVCEMETNGKAHKIYNSFVLDTSEGMLLDGAVDVNESFVTAFKTMLDLKKIKTKKVIFTISSSKIATKEVTIPRVKEKQIKDVVRANISEYFPIDPSQYMFSHYVIGDAFESAESDKPNGYRIQVLAAPKQLIFSYGKLAKALNLDVEAIDYNGNSIYQAAKEEVREGVQLIIKVDERNSLLMVTDNGVTTLNRTIPYGIDEAVTTLMETKHLGEVADYMLSLDTARRKTVILPKFDSEELYSDNEEAIAIRADKALVTGSFHNLAAGIMRVIDYYNSNNSQRPISKAFITGIGADFSGLQNLLSNELGIKVKNLTHLAGIDIEKVFKDVTYGEYVTVIGAGISPIDFYGDHDEVKAKGKGKSTKSSSSNVDPLFVGIVVGLLGLIAAIGLILYAMLPYNKETTLKAKYEKTISELQPAYDTYVEYVNVKNDLSFIKMIDNSTVNRNAQMMDFIEFMEKEFPYSFCLNSIESDKEKLTMDATVGSKEEAAYVVDKLSENDMFVSAEMTNISFIENELGEVMYEFEIELTYAPTDPVLDEENGEGA